MATEPSTTNQCDNDEEATSMKFDLVGYLPLEIAQKILFQLSPEDLYSASSCCLSWKAALSCDFFWERLCKREGYSEVEEPKRSEFYGNFFKKYNYWQGVYWYHHTLRRNWETNNYSEVVYEIDNLDCNYNQWLFDDAYAYVTKDKMKLIVYDFNSKEVNPHVFQLDCDFTGSLSKSGKYLISLLDSMLTVWNLENELTIYYKHDAEKFYVCKNLIVLPIFFEKFEVFNIETEQIEYCFEFEPWKMSYNMSLMDGRFIFTTTDDVIHILKLDDMSLVTLTCCNEAEFTENHKLMLKDDILLSFCHRNCGYYTSDIFLCIWNTKTMTKLHSTFLLDYGLEKVSLINEYIYFINYYYDELQSVQYQNIVLWDYMKRTEESTLNCELKTSRPDIYTSNDHVMIVRHLSIIKMWCLSKRDYICDLNFISRDYTYCEVEISETKLICAILPKEGHHIKVYVRDFEI